jgi:hypothetical protein
MDRQAQQAVENERAQAHLDLMKNADKRAATMQDRTLGGQDMATKMFVGEIDKAKEDALSAELVKYNELNKMPEGKQKQAKLSALNAGMERGLAEGRFSGAKELFGTDANGNVNLANVDPTMAMAWFKDSSARKDHKEEFNKTYGLNYMKTIADIADSKARTGIAAGQLSLAKEVHKQNKEASKYADYIVVDKHGTTNPAVMTAQEAATMGQGGFKVYSTQTYNAVHGGDKEGKGTIDMAKTPFEKHNPIRMDYWLKDRPDYISDIVVKARTNGVSDKELQTDVLSTLPSDFDSSQLDRANQLVDALIAKNKPKPKP